MSHPEPSRAVKLFGTESEDPKGRVLRAGSLSAVLDNGMLRYIRVGDREVMRGIAFLVRDESWGTFTPEITNLEVTEGAGTLAVRYNGRCNDADRSIRYHAAIDFAADGSVSFAVTARPDSDFLTNRTGFVVLHPLAGVVGQSLEIEHVDGRREQSTFPAVINPDCPFRNIRALTHEVRPGLNLTCRMEGYAFEMEDHRNWTDASFKTYVRPLAEPWPYKLPAGVEFTQSVRLAFSGSLPAPSVQTGERPVAIEIGAATGAIMPRIGLGLPPEEAAPALAVAGLIRAAHVDTLIAQFDGRRPDIVAIAAAVSKLANATGASVVAEIILPAEAHPAEEIAPIAAAIRAAGLRLAAVTVSPAPHLKAVLPGSKGPDVPSYEVLYAATRAAFPGVPLGGGMYSYFTELNRNPPPAELLDFVSHTTCPIVHAADDVSVMETLEALPYVIQSTRGLIKGKAYRVGPSAIPARDNPYGAGTAANPHNGRVCLARMDPRQRGLFGAAWTLGYIAAFAKGGVEMISIGAPTGPSGLIARRTDYRQPYFDDAPISSVYPVYHVISGLAQAAGRPVFGALPSDPSKLATLGFQGASGLELWIANLSPEAISVAIPWTGFGRGAALLLDADSFGDMTSDADYLARDAVRPAVGQPLTLGGYGVARLR